MLMFIVYLADVVNGLTIFLQCTGTVLAFASSFISILFVAEFNHKSMPAFVGIAAGFLMLLMAALLPTKDGIYKLAALYGVQETVTYLQTNDDAKRLAGKSIQAVEKMLDEINGEQDAKDK